MINDEDWWLIENIFQNIEFWFNFLVWQDTVIIYKIKIKLILKCLNSYISQFWYLNSNIIINGGYLFVQIKWMLINLLIYIFEILLFDISFN